MMKPNEIATFRQETAQKINSGRLHDAFADMRRFSEQAMTWEITSEIDRLEDSYRAMLGFLASGAADPGRADMLADIASAARSVTDSLARKAMETEGTTLYYTTARMVAMRAGLTPAKAVGALQVELRRLARDVESIADPHRTATAEDLTVDLFNTVWTAHPLAKADVAALTELITDTDLPVAQRAVALSAVAAGAMEFFDAARLELLLRTYMAPVEDTLAIRAFVGLCMVMFRYRRRRLPRRVADMLAAAKDFPTWTGDLATATIEFMRTRDTDRISRKLSEDIFPTLTRLGSDMRDKMSDPSFDFSADLEQGTVNPEWEEMLERDGLGDKLREMSEIQAEGGDVYMSSFRSLKHFPFFREPANWFLPFTLDHSAVASLDAQQALEVINRMPMLCDSDKYSVAMAIATAPEAMRSNASSAFDAHGRQMHDMMTELEKASEATRRKEIMVNYLRDLYRFFNLFRRKGDFFNPFAKGVDLMAVEALGADFSDLDTMAVVAEFNMRHGYYAEALAAFSRIDAAAEPDAARAQKIGYCHEMLDQPQRAMSAYEEALMLGGSGTWLLDRLARTLRKLGRLNRAVDVLGQLLEADPDNVPAVYALARCRLDLGQPDKAAEGFFKVLYLTPDHSGARLGLARALLAGRRFDEAVAQCDALIAAAPSPKAYLLAGHAARATGDMRNAINYYSLAMSASESDPDTLEAELIADRHMLAEAGVDTSDTKLIIESIMYNK